VRNSHHKTFKPANPAGFSFLTHQLIGGFFIGRSQMFAGAALQAVIAAIIFAVGAGSGWAVKDWKDGAQIAHLESNNSTLKSANDRCVTDIEGVKSAVGVITQGVEDREKAASEAMKSAETLVAKHKAAVAAIKVLPHVPAEPEAQCKAIIQEQREYVAQRHQ
jgi:hypothetical protein